MLGNVSRRASVLLLLLTAFFFSKNFADTQGQLGTLQTVFLPLIILGEALLFWFMGIEFLKNTISNPFLYSLKRVAIANIISSMVGIFFEFGEVVNWTSIASHEQLKNRAFRHLLTFSFSFLVSIFVEFLVYWKICQKSKIKKGYLFLMVLGTNMASFFLIILYMDARIHLFKI